MTYIICYNRLCFLLSDIKRMTDLNNKEIFVNYLNNYLFQFLEYKFNENN